MNPQRTNQNNLLQGGSSSLSLQGAAPLTAFQPAAPATSVQPAATSQFYQPAGTGRMLQPAANVSGAMAPAPVQPPAPAGPTQAEIDEQNRIAAENEKRTGLKSGIQKFVGDLLGMYDTIYGNLGTSAAEQRKNLETRFAKETGALGEQFTQEIPRIGTAYAARGAYRSTWRTGAEGRAQENFNKQLESLGEEYKGSMGKLGEELVKGETEINVGRNRINRILEQLPNVTDINELTTLRNELQNEIDKLTVSSAGGQSQASYLQRFQNIAPSTDRMAILSQTLTNIINGEAPSALKQSVGAQIIASSNLTDEEKNQVLADFNSQIVQPPVTQAA